MNKTPTDAAQKALQKALSARDALVIALEKANLAVREAEKELANLKKGGFVFTIGSVIGLAGATFVVPVLVSSTNGTQFGSVGGFNLALDLTPKGTGSSPGVTLNAMPISGGPLFANPSVNVTPGMLAYFGIDGIVNSNVPTGLLLKKNPVVAFNLRFDVGPDVLPGVYSISFASNMLTSVTDSKGNQMAVDVPGGYTLNSGALIIDTP